MEQEQVRKVRRFYIIQAREAGRNALSCEKYSGGWYHWRAARVSYKLVAENFKQFWPVILGAK